MISIHLFITSPKHEKAMLAIFFHKIWLGRRLLSFLTVTVSPSCKNWQLILNGDIVTLSKARDMLYTAQLMMMMVSCNDEGT
jgi:hypothetical protein